MVIEEWGLQNTTFGCTTDNAANIRNAVVDHLDIVHLQCIGHTLQLGIERGLQVSSIARVLVDVRSWFSYFTNLHN